jgi:hypothetical protein
MRGLSIVAGMSGIRPTPDKPLQCGASTGCILRSCDRRAAIRLALGSSEYGKHTVSDWLLVTKIDKVEAW